MNREGQGSEESELEAWVDELGYSLTAVYA